jgi:hypothetical protein
VKHVSFNLMFDWLTMLKQLTVAPIATQGILAQ